MATDGRSALRRAHDTAMGYHLLVGLIFTSCLPLTLARAVSGGGATGNAGPFATALDTARATAAQAMSFPG